MPLPSLLVGAGNICLPCLVGLCLHLHLAVSLCVCLWPNFPFFLRTPVMLDWGPPYSSMTSPEVHLQQHYFEIRSHSEVLGVRTSICEFGGGGHKSTQNNAQGPTTFLQISLMLTLCLDFCLSPAPGHALPIFLTGAALTCGIGHTDTDYFPGPPPTDHHLTLTSSYC